MIKQTETNILIFLRFFRKELFIQLQNLHLKNLQSEALKISEIAKIK